MYSDVPCMWDLLVHQAQAIHAVIGFSRKMDCPMYPEQFALYSPGVDVMDAVKVMLDLIDVLCGLTLSRVIQSSFNDGFVSVTLLKTNNKEYTDS